MFKECAQMENVCLPASFWNIIGRLETQQENFNLHRFIDAHDFAYNQALRELKEGRKRSHWIWYIFPLQKGLGHSHNSQLYFSTEKANKFRRIFTQCKCFVYLCQYDLRQFIEPAIKVEPITVDKKYPGTRFFFIAHMDSIVHQMSVDIGFGDVVTPCPTSIDFPLLLPNIPSVNLQAYSLETVIAEKLHTMIDRDTQNSRMKDFFDCYQLLSSRNISMDTLYEAVKATFDNRELQFNANLQLFTPSFVSDPTRIARWKSFLKTIQWKEALDFTAVMQVITKDLYPLVEKYWSLQNSKKI